MARVSLPAFALVGTCLLAAPMLYAQTKVPAKNMAKAPAQKGTEVQLTPIKTPLVFEPNKGQAASEFQWIGRGAGFRVGVGANGATIEFRDRNAATAPAPALPDVKQSTKTKEKSKGVQSSLVKLHLTGGSGWKVEGAGPTGGISNYFIGNTAANWHTDIPQYAGVKATAVYQGIDLVFHGNETALEYDFVVGPGADPKQIQIQFEGAASLQVDKASGDLVLSTPSGVELRHAQPKIYQEVGGKKVSVRGGFAVLKGDTAGFTVEKYDPKHPLVIDPTISFVRFLGGSDTDEATAVAVDGLGNSYVTGQTYSGNFPAYGGVVDGSKSGDSDAFVTKLSPEGFILFSTFLGGGDNDQGQGIAVDASGVYVAGQAWSDDFPVRQAVQYYRNGDVDIFVTKLSPSGNRLVYSTYLGGKNGENGGAITVDASQSAYVAGFTTSPDFPVVLGSYDTAEPNEGFTPRGFISKLSPSGTKLVYSTYLAGSRVDSIAAITIDSSLSAYVTGETCSPDFPFAGYQSNEFSGGCSTFVTKLSPAGDSLIYSTSLGETSIGTGIAVDATGNAYIAGSYCGGCDKNSGSFAYVAKLLPTGKISYLTYLNGSDGSSYGQGIGLDINGEAYMVGRTTSTTLPGAPPITPNPTAGFLVKMDKTGQGPLYTVLLGAAVTSVAVVQSRPHTAVVPTYPTIYTAGYRFTGGVAAGHEDAFVVKLSEAPVVVNQP
jgi:hypothetical protein